MRRGPPLAGTPGSGLCLIPQGGDQVGAREPPNPRKLPEFRLPLSGLVATPVAPRASPHTPATLSDDRHLHCSVVPQSWLLRCPRWSLLPHLGGSRKPGGEGGAAPAPLPSHRAQGAAHLHLSSQELHAAEVRRNKEQREEMSG